MNNPATMKMYYRVTIKVPALGGHDSVKSQPLPLPMAVGTISGYVQGILGSMEDGDTFVINVNIEAQEGKT